MLLVQDWDDSQVAREFYAWLLGSGTHYSTHAAFKQSVLAWLSDNCGTFADHRLSMLVVSLCK